MEIERAKRYKDKSNIVIKRIGQIESWVQDIQSSQFIEDDKTKLATYKAFQEAVEGCMDIIAMLCKDNNIVPRDDYGNIENLGLIDGKTRKALFQANGLGNRLVHRYNHTDDNLTLRGITSLLPSLFEFCRMVEIWIRDQL